ncbi:MAG: hypothetical protein LBG14_02305 [Treponema sp.]|jgi:hypothetical protein|nr:hypothetical protein [Treponema sp.]
MKLNPELPSRLILDAPRRASGTGAAFTDRADGAEAGKTRQPAPELFRDLASSLGLPGDALSASLLSLAKFFSLPLDTKLLLPLRRQALSPAPAETPRNSGPETPGPPLAEPFRAAALAAAAAAGKGVVLSPEALAGYAAALAGDDPEGEAPEDEAGDGGAETPGDKAGGARFSAPRGGKDGGLFAERIEERFPLLRTLNRIPGRDGRRWISLPFSFGSGGVDYRVSLRILLADTNGLPWKAERMALDVRTGPRRWSFLLENAPGGDARLCARAAFSARPPLKPRAQRSLRALLEGIAARVVLRDGSDGAFPEEEAGAEQWDR